MKTLRYGICILLAMGSAPLVQAGEGQCAIISPRAGNMAYFTRVFSSAQFSAPEPVEEAKPVMTPTVLSRPVDRTPNKPSVPKSVIDLDQALDVATDPATEPPQIAVAGSDVPTPPIRTPVFALQRGESLRSALTRWADRNDIQLVWMSTANYRIAASASFEGELIEAADRLLEHFDCGRVVQPLTLRKYSNALHVTDKECAKP